MAVCGHFHAPAALLLGKGGYEGLQGRSGLYGEEKKVHFREYKYNFIIFNGSKVSKK
jgi:hypothetical protein